MHCRRHARPAPPWRIGWFGIIRCARSLDLLADLVRAHPGLVEVDIRGRPARDVLPGFDHIIAATPGLVFHGAYDRKGDLPYLYSDVHFTWGAWTSMKQAAIRIGYCPIGFMRVAITVL